MISVSEGALLGRLGVCKQNDSGKSTMVEERPHVIVQPRSRKTGGEGVIQKEKERTREAKSKGKKVKPIPGCTLDWNTPRSRIPSAVPREHPLNRACRPGAKQESKPSGERAADSILVTKCRKY